MGELRGEAMAAGGDDVNWLGMKAKNTDRVDGEMPGLRGGRGLGRLGG